MSPPTVDLASLRGALLAWFDTAKRDLPWRRTRDPYAIWLSEVMLQQTQVVTVVGYWERFLQAFPTVNALAAAEEGEVLSLWSGLGYYSRARNLHRAAKAVVREHGGRFPRTAEALRELPGFGPYTAGAVASIAYGEPAALVDGNVARVFARIFEVEGLPGDRAREKRLWELARSLVEGERPGDWNQALMELGATVCRTDKPTCLLCPARPFCGALRSGRVEELPPARVRAPRKLLNLAVAVWEREDALLFGRREGKGLFGGLWELPCAEYPVRDSQLADALSAAVGTKLSVKAPLGTVRRTLTHRELELHLFRVSGRVPKSSGTYAELRFLTDAEQKKVGVSTATKKVVERVKERRTSPLVAPSQRTPVRD